jgi:hypothetical protein
LPHLDPRHVLPFAAHLASVVTFSIELGVAGRVEVEVARVEVEVARVEVEATRTVVVDAPLHFPKPAWHPVPQYAFVEPLSFVR